MVEAAAKKDETNAQRRKEAELRKERAKKFEAWSDKKEQKEKKDLRREKKDRRKDWEAREQKRLLEEGGGLEGTPLAALHKSKQQQPRQNPTIEAKPVAQEEAMAVSSSEDEDDEGELEEDYKEIKEERGAKRTKRVKPTGGMVGGGMFDDMS
jgi:ATP-dependent RNA helicase DDX55/SPB4